ncbi:hypothetical protein [Sandarakinorhabdus oryzae]|uniref:hypothetical protein n=1 Tax=Sandarakinorhabdus oryzae TaxID=2675220 RepID=UPI0012E30678|nr:hypothetical protein [Sandarakinorhabdus oryzae]
MAKRHVFEATLDMDFRWPMAGDAPFISAENPAENAVIAEDDFTRLILMKEGYRKAGDIAVAHCDANPADRDSLVYPTIFNYRQFIELSLKYMIATYGRTVGINPNWKTHRLDVLWATFAEMLQIYGTPDPDDADPIVASIVAEFSKIDPRSDAYRYPVDQKGSPLPIAFAATHLPNLADVMDAVASYFEGCDGFLSDIQGASH